MYTLERKGPFESECTLSRYEIVISELHIDTERDYDKSYTQYWN